MANCRITILRRIKCKKRVNQLFSNTCGYNSIGFESPQERGDVSLFTTLLGTDWHVPQTGNRTAKYNKGAASQSRLALKLGYNWAVWSESFVGHPVGKMYRPTSFEEEEEGRVFCVSMLSFHFQRLGGSARSNTWPLKLTLHKVAQLDFDREYRCKLSTNGVAFYSTLLQRSTPSPSSLPSSIYVAWQNKHNPVKNTVYLRHGLFLDKTCWNTQ